MKQKEIEHVDSRSASAKSDICIFMQVAACVTFIGAVAQGTVRLNMFVQDKLDVSFIVADVILGLCVLTIAMLTLACIFIVTSIIKKEKK